MIYVSLLRKIHRISGGRKVFKDHISPPEVAKKAGQGRSLGLFCDCHDVQKLLFHSRVSVRRHIFPRID